jgi:hypothetical protein
MMKYQRFGEPELAFLEGEVQKKRNITKGGKVRIKRIFASYSAKFPSYNRTYKSVGKKIWDITLAMRAKPEQVVMVEQEARVLDRIKELKKSESILNQIKNILNG